MTAPRPLDLTPATLPTLAEARQSALAIRAVEASEAADLDPEGVTALEADLRLACACQFHAARQRDRGRPHLLGAALEFHMLAHTHAAAVGFT